MKNIELGKTYIFNNLSGNDPLNGKGVVVTELPNATTTLYTVITPDGITAYVFGGELYHIDEKEIPTSETKTVSLEFEKSFTFTKQEIIDQLITMFKSVIDDTVDDIWVSEEDRKSFISMVDKFSNVRNWKNEDIFQHWCESHGEQFFIDHPEFDDVLVLVDVLPDGVKIKEWLASK